MSDATESRPTFEAPKLGAVGWIAAAAGWAVMAFAVAGALGDERLKGAGSWATWILGAAIVHDAILLPLVLCGGWLIARVVPPAWRTPTRVVVVIGAVVTLATWPIVRRYGARSDNPSILPLPTGRNLLLILALLAVVALVVGAVSQLRRVSGTPTPTSDVGHASATVAGAERDPVDQEQAGPEQAAVEQPSDSGHPGSGSRSSPPPDTGATS